jgi:hypothetical protein
MNSLPMRRAITGAIVGAVLGVLVIVAGMLAMAAIAAALVWAFSVRGSRHAVAGLLLGAGACWLLILGIRLAAPCGNTDTTTCSAPDSRPFAAFALLTMSGGALLISGGGSGRGRRVG